MKKLNPFKILFTFSVVIAFLNEQFDFVKLSTAKDMTKELKDQFNNKFGQIEPTPENIALASQTAPLIKEAGGLSAINEFLREAKEAGQIEHIRDFFKQDDGSAGTFFDKRVEG